MCVLWVSKHALCVEEGMFCVSLLSSHQKSLYYSPDTRCKMQNNTTLVLIMAFVIFYFISERPTVNTWILPLVHIPLCIVCQAQGTQPCHTNVCVVDRRSVILQNLVTGDKSWDCVFFSTITLNKKKKLWLEKCVSACWPVVPDVVHAGFLALRI